MKTEGREIEPRLIVVLGMHRSGTSAITRALQVLGVQLGDRLMPPLENNNPTGFWEDVDVNALNIEMLNELKMDWNHVVPIRYLDVEHLKIKGYLIKAAGLLRAKAENIRIFGLKDPRITKLFPFWKEVFSHIGWNVGYVLAIRNPLSVVHSLARRDGLDKEKSYLLWVGHVLESLLNSVGDRKVIIDYDRLMLSPESELQRMADCFSLEINSSELKTYQEEFLDKELQHTIYAPNDLLLDFACPPLVCDVYIAMLEAAVNGRCFADSSIDAECKEWSREFGRLLSPLQLIDKLSERLVVAKQTAEETGEQIRYLDEANEQYKRNIIDLTRILADRDTELAQLSKEVTKRDGQIDYLTAAVDEAEKRAVLADQRLASETLKTATLSEINAARDARIVALKSAIRELKNKIDEMQGSTSWKVTFPLRASKLALQYLTDIIGASDAVVGHPDKGRRATADEPPTAGAINVSKDVSRRIVVLCQWGDGDRKPIDVAWPDIQQCGFSGYIPKEGDWVYWPDDIGAVLCPMHLHNVLLALKVEPHDFFVVSHSHDVPPRAKLVSLRNSIILSSEVWVKFSRDRSLPGNCYGRLLRLLPAPSKSATAIVDLEYWELGRMQVNGNELSTGPSSEKTSNSEILDSPVTARGDDERPVIFVMPAVLAVGGVERNTIEIMKNLVSRYRFVVITNERHSSAKGSLHHQLEGLVEDTYDLAEIASPSKHLKILLRLATDYDAMCFWLCNGSPWLVENAMILRKTFPSIRIVDQQVYDTDIGWITYFNNPGIQSFDHFIAINRRIQRTFVDRYGICEKKITLIYPAIDGSRFYSKVDPKMREVFRRSINVEDEARIFAQIGRLHDQKKPIDFLKLACRSQAEGFRDVFLLIGDGDLRQECYEFQRQKQLHNVRFLTFCDDVSMVYGAISGLIISSAYEGLPIVALEAMAMGVPILATDVGDIRTVLEEHELGTLFSQSGDLDQMWVDFHMWCENLSLHRKRALEAADAIRIRFSSSSIAEQYAQCFEG